MDFGLVLGIVCIILALAGAVGMRFLKKIGIVNDNTATDMEDIASMFDVTTDMAAEIGLLDEPIAKKIIEIVDLSLEFIENNSVADPDIRKATEDFAFGLCEQFGIEITEARQELMEKMIDIGLHKLGVITDVG